MSISITRNYRVNNVLTDVTSWTLGIVRDDTGATVVAAGTAMTNSGTGIYTYSWDEPAQGLTYTVTHTVVYAGQTISWEESVSDTAEDTIPMPDLTGDDTLDTLNSLLVERLRVSRGGSKPSYNVEGHKVDWTEYLKYLDARILALRKEYAAANPVEEIGMMY